ncbi:hypothetical protein SAMN04488574_101446 [Bacillus sp. 71mf]|nr:hypothetical protein SAMN04488574_101446 [Bacillus sp. 71mf]SFS79058.1 hypothetical protein SAMN04488145_103331 [Bacillus sp. 103mf]
MCIYMLKNVNNTSEILLVLSAFCLYIYLREIKLERKLTRFELLMYILSQFAYVLWGISFIAKIWE